MKKILVLALLAITFCTTSIWSQDYPFEREIRAFKTQDSINAPILFIGSSSFTKWTDVQNDFPDYKIINRAFGGSTLENQIYYFQEVTFDYHPNKIVLYCGENDIASGASAEVVFDRFRIWFLLSRKYFPDVKIVYVSMKLSPSREKFFPAMIEGNRLIKEYLSKQTNCSYVDIVPLMMDENGKTRKDIFLDDMLHMNKKGYQIWQAAIKPYL